MFILLLVVLKGEKEMAHFEALDRPRSLILVRNSPYYLHKHNISVNTNSPSGWFSWSGGWLSTRITRDLSPLIAF